MAKGGRWSGWQSVEVCDMHDAETTLAIIQERGRKGRPLEDIYRRLYNPDLYLRAYGRIYRNAGAMTKGITGETVDGMSLGKIQGIIGLLRNERYRWTPVRRVLIPKKDGRLRPLGIPVWKDKLLQEVMRSILEAYYEPQFSPTSHGFRPDRGCGTALKTIDDGWKGTKWFIEGDIKGCFDNIDHTVLLSILRERLHDNRFLILVENMLKAGYLEQWVYSTTLSGTPQGGVISPILSNIYLDKLDKFVEQTLIPEFTKGGRRKRNNLEYARLGGRIRYHRQRGAPIGVLKPMIAEYRKLRSFDEFDPTYRRLRYIRYADDFLLGFDGPKGESEEIKRRLGEFLRDHLRLELSPEKTLITHASTEQARFLGYDISVFRRNANKAAYGHIQLRIPPERIDEKVARYKADGKPCHRPELTRDSDFSIVALYGAEYRGFAQYYAHARNRHWLARLRWVMETSLLKTLAYKHKTSTSKVARRLATEVTTRKGKKFKCFRVIQEREGKDPLIAQFGGFSLSREPFSVLLDLRLGRDRWIARNELISRLMADACELCGSREDVQVHHIRRLSDLKVRGRKDRPRWIKVMASRRRKTLVVCAYCHKAIHAGRPTRKQPSNGI
jgi:group II intron reverse transcriptase/maturase